MFARVAAQALVSPTDSQEGHSTVWNIHSRTVSRSVPAFAIAIASGCMATVACAESYPPSRNADTFNPPPLTNSPSASCTATGTWRADTGSGSGSWTGTAKLKCHPAGRWTDSFGYTWVVRKGPTTGTLTGTVNYHRIPRCWDHVWPLTGTSDKKTFTVTAPNPNGGADGCTAFFGYSLTIQ